MLYVAASLLFLVLFLYACFDALYNISFHNTLFSFSSSALILIVMLLGCCLYLP